MEIIQLNLKHFGRFTNYRLDLHAGINVISGGNETGKTTLHAFIRAMLYGITRNRSRSLDEYQLREPWENPAYFAGSMKLLHEGKIYRIDRNFHRSEESVEVVCETDGTIVQDPAMALSAFTGALSETDFDNTVFIRQAQTAAGGQLSERLRDYLINQDASANDTVDVSASLDYLKKKKKEIEAERNDQLRAVEEAIREKTQETEYVNRDLERLLEKQSAVQEESGVVAAFERVGGDETSEGEQRGVAAAGVNIGAPASAAGENSGAAAFTAGGDSGTPASASGVNNGSGALVSAASEKSAAGENSGASVSAVGKDEEEPEPELSVERDEITGVLLPAMVLLTFVTAGLMAACAYLVEKNMVRYMLVAGAIVCLVSAIALLWRLLHPMSETERVRRKVKREAFLDKHLGFREDPADPEDRAQLIRREQKARDAILRAREEEEKKEQLLQEARRARLEEAAELAQKEDTEKRGRDVEQIAKKQLLGREISLRREKLDTLRSDLEALYGKKADLTGYDDRLRALELSQKRIRELAGNIYHESGGDFARDVSEILSELTGGRYTRISLDEKMLVRLNTPDKLLGLDQVSCGTMQQVYFAVRLASAGLLAGDAQVPLILDEPFSMYDEERLQNALRLLSGIPRQVILFTCQKRELDMLSRLRRA